MNNEGLIEKVSEAALSLDEIMKNMSQFSSIVTDKLNEVERMIDVIEKSAKKSNILALNASIEAARSGEAGVGFSVVATEMGKMAELNAASAKQINETLLNMKNAMNDVADSINRANEVAHTQATAVEEMKQAMAEAKED